MTIYWLLKPIIFSCHTPIFTKGKGGKGLPTTKADYKKPLVVNIIITFYPKKEKEK